MSTVTLNATPSQEITRAASAEHNVKDARGRTITLRKPGILAQYRLIETMGESAKNEVYMDMVMPVLFVSAIDGEPVPAPMKKSEVEALIQRLDEDGITAVVTGVRDKFGAPASDGGKTAVKK